MRTLYGSGIGFAPKGPKKPFTGGGGMSMPKANEGGALTSPKPAGPVIGPPRRRPDRGSLAGLRRGRTGRRGMQPSLSMY